MLRRLPLLLSLSVAAFPAVAQDDPAPADPPAATAPQGDAGVVAKVERNSRRDPQEVEAYKAIQKRFSERARELEADVQRYLDERKKEELDKVSDGYDALVQTLEERERAQRDLAIDRLREFLVRYPGVPDSDNVRFRLAELYYEKAIEGWLDAQASFGAMEDEYDAKYEEAVAALDAGDPTLFENLEELEQPKKDLGQSISLYQVIIARNEPLPPADRWVHLDRAYYSLGFAFMDTEAKQHDYLLARKAFQELLRVAGEEGDLADAAHMFLGKLLFEEEKRFEDALDEYKAVVAKGPDSGYYYDASFQLAWTYYKLAGRNPDYEPLALELFTKLLDDSERVLKESGQESSYAPDARLNMARTLADIADRSPMDAPLTPVQVTQNYFGAIGDRTWERDIYLSLAEVLGGCVPVPDACRPGTQNWGRWEIDAAIEVFEHLQTDPRWVKHPDNPGLQMKTIWLLPQKDLPNLDEDIPAEQTKLVERYGETVLDPYTGEQVPNPWWLANRNNPDALDNVRQFIEGSLAQVAVGMMQVAQRENDPDAYRAAALKFREYLDKFPIADNFFENQWYLANALMQARPQDQARPWGSYEEALGEFTSLVESRDNHPYGDGSLFGIMTSRREIILAKGNALDELPEDAGIEKTVTTDFGKQFPVYALSDDHESFIASMDLLVGHEFDEPAGEGLPDYRESLAENYNFLVYTPALIYSKHNRFDQARDRAERMLALGAEDLEVRCNTDEVSFAATLIANSYEQEGDLLSLSAAAKRFDKYFGQCGREIEEKWGAIIEGADFLICQQKKDTGDRLGAAQCFEGYFDSHECDTTAQRENEKCKFALYNGANSYDIVGRAEKANTLFERYVRLYPTDDLSQPLFLRIANNYESTFDLAKAVDYYQRLVDNDRQRKYEGTADALYNVAFLKIGLGDHRGAATGFENYAKLYGQLDDAEDVMFRAGEQWEEVSDRDALRFYDRYLRTYGPGKDRSNPSHVIEVKYRIAQLKKARQRDYDRAMDDLQATFDRYMADGVTLSSVANRYAAERAFAKLKVDYDDYVKDSLTGNEDKDVALLEQKDTDIVAFEGKARDVISKYKDFEYGTGAFYLLGAARLYIAELVYAMDCPSKYNEDECDIWWELYEENWRPLAEEFEETARSRFTALIEQGKTQKQHSAWIDRAYETLNKLDPFNFPDVKQEARGGTDIKALPQIGPLDIPPAEGDKPEADSPWGGE